MSFYKWSQTAASNSTADGTINWAEGQAPSTVNDSARAMMAASAKERDDIGCTNATGGTSTAYTIATAQVYDNTTHLANKLIGFTASLTCGASPTLNVDGLGAFPIVNHNAVALGAGAIVAGGRYLVSFDLSNFYLLNGNNGTLDAPSGTLMLFQQTSAPTGWTKQSTHNDKALRVVTGSASSGGSNSFSGQFTSLGLGSVTIAQANLPSYTIAGANTLNVTGSISTTGGTGSATTSTGNAVIIGGSITGSAQNSAGAGSITVLRPDVGGPTAFAAQPTDSGHTHTVSMSNIATSGSLSSGLVSSAISSGGSGSALSLGNLNMAVAYVDVIIAAKN